MESPVQSPLPWRVRTVPISQLEDTLNAGAAEGYVVYEMRDIDQADIIRNEVHITVVFEYDPEPDAGEVDELMCAAGRCPTCGAEQPATT